MSAMNGQQPLRLKEGSIILKTDFGGQFLDQLMVAKMQLG